MIKNYVLTNRLVARATYPLKYKWFNKNTVNLNPSFNIKMPTWLDYSKAKKWQRKKWDKFYTIMKETHEMGHLKIFKRELNKMKVELELKKSMEYIQFESWFNGKLQDIQQEQDKYDVETKNGKLQGATLKPCIEE